MGEREIMAEQILRTRLSRRGLLKVGVTAPIGAAFLAACQAAASPTPAPATAAPATAAPATAAPATAAPATAAPATAAPATAAPSASAFPDLTGKTVRVWAGGTTGPVSQRYAAGFEELTGAKVEVTIVPFAERAIKFAGLVASQDGTIDVLYGAGSFVGQFGDRLYDNLDDPAYAGQIDKSVFVPAILPVLSANGGLRALPQHSEMEIYIYNKEHFQAAGLNPDSPPTSWAELIDAAPKLTSGNRFPCAVPWLSSLGLSGAYWLAMYNSFPGAKLLSDDRGAIAFDNEQAIETWRTLEAGFKARFFDPNLDPTVDDYGTGKLFNGGGTASQINFAELWAQAVSGNAADFGATISPDVVGASILPGVQPNTSGSINGFEGYGINKFGTQKDAAFAYILYETSQKYQKDLNLSKALPSSRVDVLNDPEVTAAYPVGAVLAAQGAYNLDRYAAPYDWNPPFTDGIAKLFRGAFTAAQAHAAAVKGVQDIIIQYLSS